MNAVTILTRPTCGYCHAAKRLLKQHGIDYREVDLSADAELGLRLLQQSGRRTVPQIFIRDRAIGGYTELAELIVRDDFDLIERTSV